MSMAEAQGTDISFGVLKTDTSQPVEVTADALDVNQEDGAALFKGNVLIIQGEMRLSADSVLVINAPEGTGIERLEARGNVLLVSGQDAAEAGAADYTIKSGTVIMHGNVLLTQGASTLGAERMVVNLASGDATLSGRVRTTLPGSGADK
ncbi:LPS export ABC transporter periplasmic protein LptC [Phaeobacter sp. HF9A]|nr:LPS export ABC transporter periplasmic protein LptC [Phaeobacter sp. HF9A]